MGHDSAVHRLLVDASLRPWRTIQYERSLLVVARTVTALNRLVDILQLTRPDWRIQPFFTHDPANPAIFGSGTPRALDRIGDPVMSWETATKTTFDLAISASENDRLHQLQAPVLLVPHGVGYQKYYPSTTVVSGLDPDRLHRDGEVVPRAIALPHPTQHEQLRAVSPAAADRALVVGDPLLDRMLASRHRAERYRARLGASGKRLVVLASTWGPSSLLGGRLDLPTLLLAQLPADEYQLVIVMHPGIWAHGDGALRGWLARAEAAGLRVLPPDREWDAALVAASCVLSDQGSLSLYAAALDKPVLLAPDDSLTTVPGSVLATLADATTRLDPEGDLRAQIDAAIDGHRTGGHEPILRQMFDQPGRCAQRLRPLIYRLIGLREPAEEAAFAPIAAPEAQPVRVPALVVGVHASPTEVAVTRYPDLRVGRAHDGLDYRHLVADVDTATASQLGAATILCTDPAEPSPVPAGALLDQWPRATMVATVPDRHGCRIQTRELVATLRMPERPAGVDPLLLASLAYVRLHRGGSLPDRDRLRIGGRIIEVAVEAGPA